MVINWVLWAISNDEPSPSQELLKVSQAELKAGFSVKPSTTASQESVCPLRLCRWWWPAGREKLCVAMETGSLYTAGQACRSSSHPHPLPFIQFPKARGGCQWVVKGSQLSWLEAGRVGDRGRGTTPFDLETEPGRRLKKPTGGG